ncbi:MAG: acetoacetate--CoA ligase, partial [Saprospiraceae bacterium]
MSEPIFVPTHEMISTSNLFHYMEWLKNHDGPDLKDYTQLWTWSTKKTEEFWRSISQYFEVIIDLDHSIVKSKDPMPKTKWFEDATLNYGEYLIKQGSPKKIALIECSEAGASVEITWETIIKEAGNLQIYLESLGLRAGDRVAAYLPNIKEASISFIACLANGYVWSVCSPDFGEGSVIDRFLQIEPKVLLAVDQYRYGGKLFDRKESLKKIVHSISSIHTLILISTDDKREYDTLKGKTILWKEIINKYDKPVLKFKQLSFNHPIWILYSSGTTGLPKAITHSHGGMLLEHLKYVHFHNDVKPGEKFFWFTTTGWMMWNYLHATWLAGAIIVLFDGNPMYPDIHNLWNLAESQGLQHFGAGAPIVHASMKSNISLPPVSKLRSISSTGSPLSAEAYSWLYKAIKHPFYLWSMSGGTDVCSAFVGGCPMRPIYTGEIQCRALGCDLHVFDEYGNSVQNQEGELVVTQSMPCMPIYFWNDPLDKKYIESYFESYPGVWRHGDWITLTDHDSLIISGRSDATLKRFGVRIGTSEIYTALQTIPEIEDSLIIHIEKKEGESVMPLFVKLKNELELSKELMNIIKNQIKSHCSPRHIPDHVIQVKDIPYTLSGKKMEAAVKKLFMGNQLSEVAAQGAMRNPEC